jgi:glycosyltransferase involved in cell wall biosynthesis
MSTTTHIQYDGNALVSVVIPVYNRVVPLKRALKSVVAQTYKNLEVLVVDDGSTEDMKSVVDEFQDVRITFLRNQINTNANVCRNIGIQKATGTYIAMMDSDDEWLAEHIAVRLAFMQQSKADGCYGSHYVDNGHERIPAISRTRRANESMADYLLSDGIAQTSTYFLKAECAKQLLWDEELKRHQDYDFSVRFSQKFDFKPCVNCTCVVHWEKGVRRSESFTSQMRFIEKHKSSISPRIYNQYHYRNFFSVVDREDIESSIVEHYRRESYRYPHHVTRTEFMSVAGHRAPALKRLLLRIKFALLVFQ